jgi:hypothetical protein
MVVHAEGELSMERDDVSTVLTTERDDGARAWKVTPDARKASRAQIKPTNPMCDMFNFRQELGFLRTG